jgi:hypothetical protein
VKRAQAAGGPPVDTLKGNYDQRTLKVGDNVPEEAPAPSPEAVVDVDGL